MSREPWDGTFAFLLTDIEGSTRLWEHAPGDMARALARHDELISTAAQAHGGRIVRSRGEGDSAFVAFDTASEAVRCGVELQRAFAREPWPPMAHLRVRMAVHRGPAVARDDDYFGPSINRAARLRATAHGGQLIVSEDVRSDLLRSLPEDVTLRDLGLHRLKDLTLPEHVWQVNHPDLPGEFPPLRSLEARRHNLPVQLTSFIGRDLDVADVRKRLETTPLVTLTGPGGIGKTRLALQVAADAVDDFADGAWLVELAPVRDPALVPRLLASTLGLPDEPGRTATEALADHLRDQRALVVLDNCEHLIDAAANLTDALLRAAAGLRILATSREPLRSYGEAVYSVTPLDVPASPDAPAEDSASSESVRLFCDRAALADRSFAVTGDVAAVVAAICRRLEGVPLAIELAAAMTGPATVDEIAQRLESRLGALRDGPRTAPERQQTLRATIDWSYGLLEEAERTLLARLAVFAGGFTAEAASEVCADASVPASDVPALVQRLTDRSLLYERSSPAGRRFDMLDTIREYARSSGATGGTEARHLRWCRSVAFDLRDGFFGRERASRIARTIEEHDNIRAALGWGLSNDPVVAGEIAGALYVFWQLHGHLTEGRQWLEQLIERIPPGHVVRTRVLYAAGWLALVQGDQARAHVLVDECLAIARALNDIETAGMSLNLMALVVVQQGRTAEAKAYAFEALNLLRRFGNEQQIAQSLNLIGVASSLEGDQDAARTYYEEALAIAREHGVKENIAKLVMNLGNIALGKQEFDRAGELYSECLALAEDMGDVQTAAGAKMNLAAVARHRGDLAAAQALLEDGLAQKRELGDVRGIAIALHGLGDVLRLRGERAAAVPLFMECLEVARSVSFTPALVQVLESIAALRVADGDPATAAKLSAAAERARSSLGLARSPEDSAEFERVVADAERLDPAGFADAWAEGSELELGVAVGEILGTR